MNETASLNQAEQMDRSYRFIRRVYDPTRRCFLLGRDRLLEGMDIRPGDRVLEVGCGTGRNLIRLHRRCPEARLFGIDASNYMHRAHSPPVNAAASVRRHAMRPM